jgi:hypothetical protein
MYATKSSGLVGKKRAPMTAYRKKFTVYSTRFKHAPIGLARLSLQASSRVSLYITDCVVFGRISVRVNNNNIL